MQAQIVNATHSAHFKCQFHEFDIARYAAMKIVSVFDVGPAYGDFECDSFLIFAVTVYDYLKVK